MSSLRLLSACLAAAAVVWGCSDEDGPGPADVPRSPADTGTRDATAVDVVDAGPDIGFDAAVAADSGAADTGAADTGAVDSGADRDAGVVADAGATSTFFDAGMPETAVDGIWTWGPIAPTASRFGHAMSWSGAHVFVYGGRTTQCASSTLWYNPTTDRWSSGEVHTYASTAVHTGVDIMLVSGLFCGLTPTYNPRVDVYDLDTFQGELGVLPPDAPDGDVVAGWTGSRLVWYGAYFGTPEYRMYELDPATDTLTQLNSAGPPLAQAAGVWTGAGFIIYGGMISNSGRFDYGADMWMPIRLPSFTFGPPETAVWTGTEMIVYDGRVTARYDPVADLWSRTATVGEPVDLAQPQAVWTGTEMLLIGADGGAHYNPAQDGWRPVNSNFAHFPRDGQKVVWTGGELVVYGSTVPGQSATGGRYGPKLSGTADCDGGQGGLQVEITQPTSRQAVSGQQAVSLETAGGPVRSIEWKVDGQPAPLTAPTGSIDFGGRSRGVTTLQVVVTDTSGQAVCHERSVYVDAPPTLTVTSPAPGEVATPSVGLEAACTDDSGTCRLLVRVGEETYASAPGASTFARTVDLSARDGETTTIEFIAIDGRHQRTSQSVDVVVEASAALTRVVRLPQGNVCDVSRARLLYDDAQRRFHILEFATGVDTVITGLSRASNCADSRLIAPDRALIRNSNLVYVYDGSGLSTPWDATRVRSQLPWVASESSGRLELRHVGLGTVETVGSGVYLESGFDVGPNGHTYWVNTAGELSRYVPGQGNTTLGTTLATNGRANLVATSSIAMFSEFPSAGQYRLMVYDGTSIAAVFGPRSGSPRRDREWSRGGEYVAYEGPDAVGTDYLWRRDSAPAVPVALGARLRGISGNGDVAYVVNNRLFVFRRDTGQSIEVGADRGTVFTSDEIFVRYGDILFRVVP